MTFFLSSLGPPRLVVPPGEPVAGAWPVLVTALVAGSALFVALAAICVWAWRIDSRRATDPYDRAFLALGRAAGLSSTQRELVKRLASHLGPNTPPAGLLLSKAALRKAVAIELDHKPEPASVRELQRLVEALVGDIASPAAEPPSAPPAHRVRNRGAQEPTKRNPRA